MRRLIQNDLGDAVMVTAVLMLSLGMSLAGSMIVQTGEIEGKEEDMGHSSSVEDSFGMIRGSMRALLDSEDMDTRISTRVTLGTWGNPYLGVARSSGYLVQDPDSEPFRMDFSIVGSFTRQLNSVHGMLTYETSNYYYHDQTFHLQSGGILLEEYENETMTSMPSIQFVEEGTGYGMIMYSYSMTAPRWSIAGSETVLVKVLMKSYSRYDIDLAPGESFRISINGIGEEAWSNGMNYVLMLGGLVPDLDFTVIEPSDWADPAQSLVIDIHSINSISLRTGDMEVVL